MLFHYLKRCNINTHAKATIYKELTEVPKNERIDTLIDLNLLDDEIRIDLLSELADFGYFHFTKQMCKNVFVAWNTKQLKQFHYCFKKFPASDKNVNLNGKGVVPKALIYDVDKNTFHYALEWLKFVKIESHLELRFGDVISRTINFDQLSSDKK